MSGSIRGSMLDNTRKNSGVLKRITGGTGMAAGQVSQSLDTAEALRQGTGQLTQYAASATGQGTGQLAQYDYGTVRQGSRGDDVTRLQEALNRNGYDLAADGIFGSNTLTAVQDYQRKTGLSVDGIVGDKTWSALMGGSSGGTGGASGITGGTATVSGITGGVTGSITGDVTGAAPSTYTPAYSQPADVSAYIRTPENPAYTFEEFMQKLRGSVPAYTPLTDEEREQRARDQYDPIFNQEKLSAEQARDKANQALMAQKEEVAASYDKASEQSAASFMQAYSQAGNESLQRGMQRSSYAGQTLANINTQGAKAQSDLRAEQARAEGQIDSSIALNTEQTAQYVRQLETDYARNVSAYKAAMEDRDYERAQAAAQNMQQIEAMIYEVGQQQQLSLIEQEQFYRQFMEQQSQYNRDYEEQRRRWELDYAMQQEQMRIQQEQFQAQMDANKKGGSGGGGSVRTVTAGKSGDPKGNNNSYADPKAKGMEFIFSEEYLQEQAAPKEAEKTKKKK